MTNKPVFLWWAHKMMWDILANDPKLSKGEALWKLQETHPKIDNVPKCCFACKAQEYYGRCLTERCPLDWNVDGYDIPNKAYGCEYAANTLEHRRSGIHILYMDAHFAKQYELARKLAITIRDLPLRKNAYELYNIKESPNE